MDNLGSDIMQELDHKAREMRERVFRHMLETRSWKYRLFLRQLKLFKYLAFAPTRGTFLESYYVMMRYLDDITDGDSPLPEGETDIVDYLESKIRFARDPTNPMDKVDYMMTWCNDLAGQFEQDFTEETVDIIQSLIFDAKRRGTHQFFRQNELSKHFHQMDIKGTIRATLKVFNDDPDKYLLIEPLGMASRYQFDIEDIKTDLANGYVNITKEEADELGITAEHLTDPNSAPIKRWLRKHALDGLLLLQKHHKMLREDAKQFSWLQLVAFKWVYERPARQVFNQTISETNELS